MESSKIQTTKLGLFLETEQEMANRGNQEAIESIKTRDKVNLEMNLPSTAEIIQQERQKFRKWK